jgi:hypothetical protein
MRDHVQKTKFHIVKEPSGKRRSFWMLLPVFGTIIFVALYIIATLLYPGGSQVNKNAVGFSWINNYWCNLLNDHAINGQHNAARPVALVAMTILCMTLAYFWYLFPKQINFSKYNRLAIQIAGAISMTIAMFLFTDLHDIIINIASLFGLISLIGTYAGLYRIKLYKLFWIGMFNVPLVALNNYVYYSKGLIIYLPVIQKISFAFFLFWLCCINIVLYRKTKLDNY